ncbi:OB-fold nucleic acid binding domain-containing protein [Methanobrevibacter sp.]|uniref:OB-fold nucleic acid binding domain-containing protein n=1 Tax=Methanobrevibacter sp. TaxID=66852 RepID=UPI0026E06CCF|nr:OB-fold nucleic acid binding domain-containing protein [Methanobrevibacter sp.]MDO5823530.1 OB-fold nucleic acid binding domain-containing protein [Methanobrevibacter sp.]
MQEEILKLYEKIKDQLTEEEFQKEMDELRESNAEISFFDDLDIAKLVLQNHGIESSEITQNNESNEVPFEISLNEESDDETGFIMTEEISEFYDKVKDKISQEDFLARMEHYSKNNKQISFMDPSTFAEMVVGEFRDDEVEMVSEKPEFANNTIDKLEDGSKDVTISGRVISISNPRSFKTRKGQSGEVCNVELMDSTGKIRAVFWTQNIKLLKNVNEGNIIQIKNVDIKEGYSGLEANLRPRSILVHLDEDPSKFPEYKEIITDIADIKPETKVNIIARIVRIPTIRSYEKNGKEGKVASIELQDYSGKITYTLWNKNVELIEDLKLEDGDTVKIIQAQARERMNRDGESEISLTHWDGRIIKGDFDVPEVKQEFTPIGDVYELKDVSIKGIVSRLQDIRTFIRKTDNTEGRLRNFDVRDITGEIRVTLWGDDTDLPINKGDIIKVIGGDVRYDEYTQSQYSMNTNFNTQITINPENLSTEELDELNKLREELRPIPIGEIYEIDDDGIEIDVIGRILSVDDVNEFQREDGTVGTVRSLMFADESGKVRLSLWNERAQEEYSVGDAYRIENARTRLGMYSVDLNIGSGARLIRLSEEQASAMFIPELSSLEKALYDYKKISDIDEDDQDIIVIGRVIELSEIHEFERDNGDSGFVRNIEIADETGSLRVVLWDADAKREFEMGQPIKLQNPRFDLDNDSRIEAIVNRNTAILEPSESEIEKLPSQDELMEAIYVPKTIESLAEDDVNVCVTGTIVEVDSNRIISKKCPSCNGYVEGGEDENVCDNCGHVFDEPKTLLMVPLRIEDDTGDIKVTFFDKLAEELIGMKKEEIVNLVDDGYGIEEKLEDLNGETIEIIANVSFDMYSEENRLNPKKILSKYY